MRKLLAVILVLGIAGIASAANLTNYNIIPDKATYVGDGFGDGREGGETFTAAVAISGLPYSDSGGTCNHVFDNQLTCVGSPTPDVFYSFIPTANMSINVSLCGSGFDTALGVFQGTTEIGCNDDFCGLQSEIDNIAVTAGQIYYIQVCGYSSCGSYVINVTRNEPCVITCPPGALLEGEPPCSDNYSDAYNGGCNSTPNVFQLICPQGATNDAIFCGMSGTYLYTGSSYRDTDWLKIYGNNMTVSATVRAAFPVQFIFIYGPDCNNLVYDITSGGICQDLTLSHYIATGAYAWIWVGPSVFSGIPCETPYLLTLTGIGTGEGCGSTPTEKSSWGAIKNLYR